ncbi:HAMP domain-containing sensor histidine kinase [Flavobacterium paronense]|uniref:histidine kinase n=1 Tax=Flavobacterium paronense TaxID=1392775 RepID=A0ABV5GGH4_9FLAO|nr:HAMP domain-containing sensor histidine kinase [Flavobacterium paronense]MDN3677119.1 HAMP domain-containing sensor histidine kinase [Flavobacterium paronense]
MQQLSFKNRIASNYIITTALLIFVVFCVIYGIVRFSVYIKVNNDIKSEVAKHLKEIEVKENCVLLIREKQWKKIQFNKVDISPAFIQFVDELGAIVDKSPNLKQKKLNYYPEAINNVLFDAKLEKTSVRQIQVPLYQNTKIIGYMIIAMSLEDSVMVLNNLFFILIVAYPLILIVLFLIARFIAGRSIKPISSIIQTSNIITKDNLKSRIPLPINKDELHLLSNTINNLLDRVENAIEREKQFTSDASHELRTPLAVIKGTLEVLIRKPRNQEEYKEKIDFCINEVNRLNFLVDELLLLARFENQKQSLKIEKVLLNAIFLDIISRNSTIISEKKLKCEALFSKDFYVDTDSYLFSIIINNILTNAIKYSKNNGKIHIDIREINNKILCTFSDSGIGIATEDLEKIFDQFYRSKSNQHPEIKGTGLGLSIVKRLCILLQIDLNIESKENVGTKVVLSFSK